jgi:Antirepressor regulating drug resistance, predicted signal transduction N-terminal membrane component
METLLLYLLKSTIWLIVFGAIYYFFLRKESFFLFNRFFLLTGLLAAFFFPLIQYTYQVEIQLQTFSFLDYVTETTTEASSSFSFWDVLPFVYIIGMAIACLSLLFQLFRISNWARKGEKVKMNDTKIIRSNSKQGSFTFLNRIFIDSSNSFSEREQELVFRHEEAHVKQKHWMDLFLGQLLIIIQWFNPLAYLYLRFIKNNQEYLADEAVLKQETHQAVYQAAIINSTLKIPVFNITNLFSTNQLNRIKMMKTKSKNKVKLLSAFLLLPALACFLWAFAKPEYVYATPEDKEIKIIESSTYAIDGDTITVPKTVVYIEKENIGVENTDNEPTVLIVNGEIKSLKNPENQSNVQIITQDGEVEVYKDGKKTVPVVISKGNSAGVTSDAHRKIINTVTQEGKTEVFVNGKRVDPAYLDSITDGKVKRLSYSETKTITDDDGKTEVFINGKKIDLDKVSSSSSIDSFSPSFIILNGKEVEASKLKDISNTSIKEIKVIKGEEAIEKYGERAKDGVVIITTMNKEEKKTIISAYDNHIEALKEQRKKGTIEEEVYEATVKEFERLKSDLSTL